MHTHPYEYTYANPTPMSTSEGLSTDRSRDSQSHHRRLVVDGNVPYHLMHNVGYSRSHHWRLVVDGNVAYHLTNNAGKFRKIQEKVRALGFEPWWLASHWTILPFDYSPIAGILFSTPERCEHCF
jgi:hypothetical protein